MLNKEIKNPGSAPLLRSKNELGSSMLVLLLSFKINKCCIIKNEQN